MKIIFLLKQFIHLKPLSQSSPIDIASHKFYNPQLRDYQKECILACLNSWKDGLNRVVVSLPVGSGKTVIFSELIKHIPEPKPGASKVLVLAHREELLLQARNQLLRHSPNLKVEIEKGKLSASIDADVVVASVPTLGRASSTRILQFDPNQFKCIVIDEAHHSVAESYLRIANHFKVFDADSHIKLFGCSATVHRTDFMGLEQLYQKIAFHVDIRTMFLEKWLCPVEFYTVHTNIDISSAVKARKFHTESLSIAVNTTERNKLVVETWERNAFMKEKCRSTLVFGVDLAHVYGLQKAFRDICVDAQVIDANTKPEDRARIISEFKSYKIPVLINCGVLTEGTDIPNIDCIVMARPTNSQILYIQMVGRGLRLSPEKQKCVILDFCDRIGRTMTLISFPSLLAKKNALAEGEEAEEGEEKDPILKPFVKDIDRKAVQVIIKRSSPWNVSFNDHLLDWITISNSLFILPMGTDEFLLLVATHGHEDEKIATHFLLHKWSFDRDVKEPTKIIEEPLDSSSILDFTYKYLKEKKALYMCEKNSGWKCLAGTEAQKNALNSIFKQCHQKEENAKMPYKCWLWNRGSIARVLAKYKFLHKLKRNIEWNFLIDGLKLEGYFGGNLTQEKENGKMLAKYESFPQSDQAELKALSRNIYKSQMYEEWTTNVMYMNSECKRLSSKMRSNIEKTIEINEHIHNAKMEFQKLEEKWDVLTAQIWYQDEDQQIETKNYIDSIRKKMETKVDLLKALSTQYDQLKENFDNYELNMTDLLYGISNLRRIYLQKLKDLKN